MLDKNKIPAVPSIRRLPSYLHVIRQAENEGYQFISGTFIAQELHLEPIQVRKDLAITGIAGTPKRGYPVVPLIGAIERFLGWDRSKNAVIIGAGNLATALTGYSEFCHHGLNFVAAFDSDEKKAGSNIHGVPVFPLEQISGQVKKLQASIAVLTVPSNSAQETADLVVAAGIKAIWNFTNVKIKVPDTVVSQREDLTSGYAVLSVMMGARLSV
ncbi:MAG: redox-sensing transcriptional repressor Rex [Bacteroides sp.]|nr:redox-sensing transcriptional repressor Rex [Prevotella sp.]MCM1408201.1 redox-sensing transcriptional repressor Rex [Treponema brennaborense]MCM1469525.1 redox-sensing transcriptional repressor Rex [Bacteroides sp.]